MQKRKKKVSSPSPQAAPHTPPPAPPASINPQALLRLRQVLELIPVSRSAFLAGVKSGRYPVAPIKLGPGTTCYRASEILAITEGGKP